VYDTQAAHVAEMLHLETNQNSASNRVIRLHS
jgi:hypothetical protein